MVRFSSTAPADTATVLVVDDHPLVAVALVTALQRQGLVTEQVPPDDPAALHRALGGSERGVLVLDLDLGGARDGVELIPIAHRAEWTVLVFTGCTDRGRLASAIAGGAVGWVSKSQPFEEVLAVIEAVAGGAEVFDAALRAELVAEHRERTRERGHLDELWARLTRREREVLDRLTDGRRATGIAEEFVVSVATVRTQIRSILAKLEVSSQLEAVALARRRR